MRLEEDKGKVERMTVGSRWGERHDSGERETTAGVKMLNSSISRRDRKSADSMCAHRASRES